MATSSRSGTPESSTAASSSRSAVSWRRSADVAAGKSIDVKGSSGTLDYDPVTEETTAPMDVWVINAAGDGFETIATVDP